MKGADIGLISLYHNKIYDLHSNDFVLPIMDKIQNWKLLNLIQHHDYIVIQIQRKLLTCDYDDFDIKTNRLKHRIMIAYNLNDLLLSSTTDYKLNIAMHSHQQIMEI
eukprot:175904_1